MNKKMFLIFGILLLLPTVYAQGLEIEKLKLYVNDVRELSLEDIKEDMDSADMIEDIRADDVIEITMKLLNTWNKELEDISVKGIIEDIDDGSNLIVKLDKFNLDDEDDVTKTIIFTIPSEVRVDDYWMKIEMEGEYENGTEIEMSVGFELDVIKTGSSSTGTRSFNIAESFDNLTKLCGEYVKEVRENFDLVDELKQCNFMKGGFEENAKNCKTNLETAQNEKTKCENEKENMIKISMCDKRVEDAGSENDWLIPAGLIFCSWYFFIRKKKKEEDQATSKHKEELPIFK